MTIKLEKGDTIGIVALAGDCDSDRISNSVQKLQNLGYKVKLSKNIYEKERYLAGSDEDKIAVLHDFYLDDDVKLILNARGGYGSIRLINKINYDTICKHPKPFVGFSDITALLLMIYKKTSQITYHGPMAVSYDEDDILSVHTNLIKAISDEQLEFKGDKIYNKTPCDISGIIWGGNLSTVVSLCGQDFIPSEDFIFFAEDLNEPVYKIDRMFTQLFNIDEFAHRCKAVVLGDFLGVDDENLKDEFFKTLPCPVVGGFSITHAKNNVTIPIGRGSLLDGTTLVIN